MLKNLRSTKAILLRLNSRLFSRQVFPASLPGVSAGYCQRALADKSGMIITRMGKHNRPVMVIVLGTPCVIPPRNSNITSFLSTLNHIIYFLFPCIIVLLFNKRTVHI
jgi:hypothetical protein